MTPMQSSADKLQAVVFRPHLHTPQIRASGACSVVAAENCRQVVDIAYVK